MKKESCCIAKQSFNWGQRKPTEWKKMFASYTFDKDKYLDYTKYLKLNIKEKLKNGLWHWMQFSEWYSHGGAHL